MKNYEFDDDLYTTLGEMTVPQMKSYLRDMRERELQLENRLRNVDSETESLSSAIERATFQKSVFSEQIDENEYSSKSDSVFYFLEHAKQMLQEQAMDIAYQTSQINEEKRKINNIKYIISFLSQNARVVIKSAYFDESEWNADAELVKAYRQTEKYDCRQVRFRTLTKAVEELTKKYNQSIAKRQEKKNVIYSMHSVTVEES